MSRLIPCPSCDRHVHADGAANAPCPFCGEPLPAELAIGEVSGGRWRWQTVTAAALAGGLSTIALGGCETSMVPLYGAPCPDGGCSYPVDDAGGDARLAADAIVANDAQSDATLAEDGAASTDAAPDGPADADAD